MSPDDPRHGTNAGYLRHTRTGVPSCAPCRAARGHYEKRRKYDAHTKGGRLVNPTGTARRVQALVAMGWTFPKIGAELGITGGAVQRIAASYTATIRRSVAERVAAVYDRLSMTFPPTTTTQEKRDASYALAVARRHGWSLPWSWDNIDDPNEQPAEPAARTAGRPKVRDAIVEDFDWLVSQGVSETDAAARVGVQVATIPVYRRRLEQEAC